MGNLPSGVDGWLGDTALPSLWAPTFFFLQWLWSCFHGNRAWWTLFTLPIYIVRNKTLLLLPGKSHGWRSLVGCSPWGHKESDTTERLHFHFSLSWIGEGNGNPLQCSCLENPRNEGAWWAAVYGVTQSWARLKWLSSSSSSRYLCAVSVSVCVCVWVCVFVLEG